MQSPSQLKVAVAMSGGVDSSVAASLLKGKGYEVTGITFKMQTFAPGGLRDACSGTEDIRHARAAAAALNIAHTVADCSKAFESRVLRPSWEAYGSGRTPNPCIICNERVKFAELRKFALEIGAPWMATGHYARIGRDRASGQHLLQRGADQGKDQSYFLSALTQEQLGMTLLPNGGLTKKEIRSEARALGLPNAEKPESQDACFSLANSGFAEALGRKFGARAAPGVFVDLQGRVLGPHHGIHRYTIGQRKGLGIALGRKSYVVAIDAKRNSVVIGQEKDLMAKGLRASEVKWIGREAPRIKLRCGVQIRYRHQAVQAEVAPEKNGLVEVRFFKEQKAVTPGQAVVFYDGDLVLGGGWIDRALPE